MGLSLALNVRSSCFSIQGAHIGGVHHCAWPILTIRRVRLSGLNCQRSAAAAMVSSPKGFITLNRNSDVLSN